MNTILDDFKQVFRSNNRLAQLIIVNAAIFVVINILNAAFSSAPNWLTWVGVSTEPMEWITRPWTLLTYSFTHLRFGHVLWNLLTLYWFGRIFTIFMPGDKLLWLYIAGGVYAGLFFALSTFIPGLYPASIALIGASGSIMAIVVASAMLAPDYQMNLILIGPVRLKYVALGIFIISTVIDFNVNLGGKLAHLGGAIFGYYYITMLRRGHDLTAFFKRAWNTIYALFTQKKSKMKVVHKKARPQANTQSHPQSKIDAILDKINESGYDSLTKEEKDILFKAGRND